MFKFIMDEIRALFISSAIIHAIEAFKNLNNADRRKVFDELYPLIEENKVSEVEDIVSWPYSRFTSPDDLINDKIGKIMHHACRKGSKEMVEMLMGYGGKVIVDSNSYSDIPFYCTARNPEVLNFLLKEIIKSDTGLIFTKNSVRFLSEFVEDEMGRMLRLENPLLMLQVNEKIREQLGDEYTLDELATNSLLNRQIGVGKMTARDIIKKVQNREEILNIINFRKQAFSSYNERIDLNKALGTNDILHAVYEFLPEEQGLKPITVIQLKDGVKEVEKLKQNQTTTTTSR